MSLESWRPGPAAPSLSEGGVDVWRVELDDPGWQSSAALSCGERERAERLREGPVRTRWSASRRALRSVLGRYLGEAVSAPVEFVLGPHGKPALPGATPIRFNLSHSAGLSLIAVAAEFEVGIDLERIDHREDIGALARHAFDADTAAAVMATSAEELTAVFHQAWVRREAIAKCGGQGLGGEPSPGPVSLTPLVPRTDYAAALAVAASTPARLRCFAAVPSTGW